MPPQRSVYLAGFLMLVFAVVSSAIPAPPGEVIHRIERFLTRSRPDYERDDAQRTAQTGTRGI